MTRTHQTICALDFSDDQQLVAGLLEDDPRAWRYFHQVYKQLICQCIGRIIRPFSCASADDVEEVYASLCLQLIVKDKHKLRRFEPERGTKLRTWIALLANRAAYDFLRGKRRHVVEAELTTKVAVADDADDPLESCLMHERTRILSTIVTQFSSRDQQFMRLYFERGLTAEEVAHQLGISVKTVYSKKHKIKDRLVDLLERRRLAA